MKKTVLIMAALIAVLGVNAQSISMNASGNKNVRSKSSNNWVANNKMQENQKAIEVASNVQAKSLLKGAEIKKTISSKSLQNGGKYNIYQLNNGRIVKTIDNPAIKRTGDKVSFTKKDYLRAESRSVAATATLFEGFEGWDGTTADWIPTGWTDQSKTGSLTDVSGYNFTWETGEGYYTVSSEGEYMAGIQFATFYDDPSGAVDSEGNPVQIMAGAQDEWLSTPTISPKANEKLYFNLAYNACFLLIDLETFEFDKINGAVEVYISENGGTTWTKEWDVLADAQSYSEDELWDVGMSYSLPWKTFSLNLSKYVGKNIKIAFRYANPKGDFDSVFLDAVKVGVPTPEALYSRPDGYFYWGASEDYRTLDFDDNSMFGPAYEPAKWYNYSNLESEKFTWTFADPANLNNTLTFTDIDPVIEYPYAYFSAPTLTASATGAQDSTYTWYGKGVTTGGTSVVGDGQGGELVLGVGNYDLSLDFYTGRYSSSDATKFIFGTNSDDFWAPIGKLSSIGNYFEKPLHKYAFDKVWIHCASFAANPNAELTLTIRRVSNGVLADTIATAVCYGSEVEHIAGTLYTIPFNFYAIDPETQREEQIYLEIEDAIFMEFGGFLDGNVTSIAPLMQYESHLTGESNSYAFVVRSDNGNRQLINSADALMDGASSFYFNMDLVYPFMFAAEDKLKAPDAGGTVNFDITSYFYPTDETPWNFVDELPSWLSFGSASLDAAGDVILPVIVDALPAGVDGRSAKIKIATKGSDVTLEVIQGNSVGVSTDVVDSAIKAVRQGDNFVLSYPADVTSVAVYNVLGAKVAEYALNAAGEFTLPAAGLVKGAYVLKFAGASKSVKIVK